MSLRSVADKLGCDPSLYSILDRIRYGSSTPRYICRPFSAPNQGLTNQGPTMRFRCEPLDTNEPTFEVDVRPEGGSTGVGEDAELERQDRAYLEAQLQLAQERKRTASALYIQQMARRKMTADRAAERTAQELARQRRLENLHSNLQNVQFGNIKWNVRTDVRQGQKYEFVFNRGVWELRRIGGNRAILYVPEAAYQENTDARRALDDARERRASSEEMLQFEKAVAADKGLESIDTLHNHQDNLCLPIWLIGVTGSGKSYVANTYLQHFWNLSKNQARYRFGVHFFIAKITIRRDDRGETFVRIKEFLDENEAKDGIRQDPRRPLDKSKSLSMSFELSGSEILPHALEGARTAWSTDQPNFEQITNESNKFFRQMYGIMEHPRNESSSRGTITYTLERTDQAGTVKTLVLSDHPGTESTHKLLDQMISYNRPASEETGNKVNDVLELGTPLMLEYDKRPASASVNFVLPSLLQSTQVEFTIRETFKLSESDFMKGVQRRDETKPPQMTYFPNRAWKVPEQHFIHTWVMYATRFIETSIVVNWWVGYVYQKAVELGEGFERFQPFTLLSQKRRREYLAKTKQERSDGSSEAASIDKSRFVYPYDPQYERLNVRDVHKRARQSMSRIEELFPEKALRILEEGSLDPKGPIRKPVVILVVSNAVRDNPYEIDAYEDMMKESCLLMFGEHVNQPGVPTPSGS